MPWQRRGNVYKPNWNLRGPGGFSCGGPFQSDGRWKWIGGGLILLMVLAKMADPKRNQGPVGPPPPKFENVAKISANDPEMSAAIERARDTVAEFIAALKNPALSPEDFFVKGKFSQDGHVEHMWVKDITFVDNQFVGRLANDPDIITNLHYGDRVTVPIGELSDWCYETNGQRKGAYTIEVLESRLRNSR